MELQDVLSDAEVKVEQLPAGTEEASTATPQQDEGYKSRKQRHQESEFGAQGLERDPDTGQFKKKEAEVKAEEPAPEVKSEALRVEEQKQPDKPAQEQLTPRERAFLQAAEDERRKRQEERRENEELRRQLAEKKEEPKTFWDDPEGALEKQKREIERVAINTKMATAEAIARSRHADFDEKVAAFGEMVQSMPGLYQQFVASPDPAEFAYTAAKNHQELKQAGGIEELKKQVAKETEAKVRAQIEAELKAKAEAAEKARRELPGSLSDVRGTQVNRTVWNGPTPMEDILKG